jgi:hypothetical protein
MIDKFYTLKDLLGSGLTMRGSGDGSPTDINEYYLKPQVINMWDWDIYDNYYTYIDDDGCRFCVYVCVTINEKGSGKLYKLHKDLSNLPKTKYITAPYCVLCGSPPIEGADGEWFCFNDSCLWGMSNMDKGYTGEQWIKLNTEPIDLSGVDL